MSPAPTGPWRARESRDDWQEEAACRGAWARFDRVLDMDRPTLAVVAEAEAVCEGCPVVAECEALVASLPPSWRRGVWAGRLVGTAKAPRSAGTSEEPPPQPDPGALLGGYADALRGFLARPDDDGLAALRIAREAVEAAGLGSGAGEGVEGGSEASRAS